MQFFVKSTCYLVTVSVKTLLLRNFRQKKCERKFLHFPHSAAPKILSESSKILLFPRHLSNKSNQSRSFSLVNYFSSNWHEFLSYHKKDPKITIIVLTKIVENHAEKIFREINYSVTSKVTKVWIFAIIEEIHPLVFEPRIERVWSEGLMMNLSCKFLGITYQCRVKNTSI